MPSRRTLLGRLGTFGLLGTSLVGVASADAVDAAAATDPTDGERVARSRTAADAVAPVDGDTVVSAVVDPAAVATVGLPEPWSTRLSAAMARANVALDDADSIAGSAGLSGTEREGTVVVRGSFDPDALAAAVEDRGRWSTARTRRSGRTVHRFHGREEPYAVAASDEELVVGYAPTVDRAGSRVDAALGRSRGAGTSDGKPTDGAAAVDASIPGLLSGDVAVSADLGESGRSRLESALSGAPDALRASVEAAGSVGVALDVGGGDGTGLRYAATLDPTRLTRDRVRRLSGGVDAEGALEDATVGFRGRTVVVDATPTREDLFAVHDDLLSGGGSTADDDPDDGAGPGFGR
ncbi:hypothetical protein [Halorubrum aethiopicum]|uniref:hypothetical protein n=1 Tax=Halorubrum aethiopicum TaxID=1758255 RepID=UPI00082D5577|nr:hypothetical protein [Halorubrum aethiopicum]